MEQDNLSDRGIDMATTERDIPDGERLARVETRVEHLEQQMIEVGRAIRELSSKVDRNFPWTLGIIISMWITVILSVAGLYAVVLRA